MRSITISYRYAGPEEPWRTAIEDFISAIDADAAIADRFTYQVAVADDGETRIHWGRWDDTATLETLQSRDYFKAFAGKVKEFSGGTPHNTAADVAIRTGGW